MSRVKGNPTHGPVSIYYLHPLLAGSVGTWKAHIERASAMGFTHLCVGPIFAPGPSGNIFLTDGFEQTNPAIEDGAPADVTTRDIAELCGRNGLALLLDLALDRIAAAGAMARAAPHWF